MKTIVFATLALLLALCATACVVYTPAPYGYTSRTVIAAPAPVTYAPAYAYRYDYAPPVYTSAAPVLVDPYIWPFVPSVGIGLNFDFGHRGFDRGFGGRGFRRR